MIVYGAQGESLLGGGDDDVLISGGGNGAVLAGGAGNDLLIGRDGSESLQGGDGADEIRASGGNDSIEGNAGRDRLLGGAGNDLYIYRPGDGIDRISDSGGSDTGDTLVFGAGITPTDVFLTASGQGDDVLVTFAGNTGDVIVLSGQLFAQQLGIDAFSFADGTSWSRAEILSRLSFTPFSGTTQNGSAASETLLGGHGNDTLGGGGGVDLLSGGFGSDSYQFNLGDGHDEIVDQGSILDTDRLAFGAGILSSGVTLSRSASTPSAMTLSVNASDSVQIQAAGAGWGDGIERFLFADGTALTMTDLMRQYLAASQTSGSDVFVGFDTSETIDTGNGADTLIGGKGDDVLKGGAGNDIYRFALGDGQDVITDTSGTDTIQFGAGIGPQDIRITQSGTDSASYVLTIAGTTDSITLDSSPGAGWSIEQVTFADGTVWTATQLLQRYTEGQTSAGNDIIVGFDNANDVLNGGSGDDWVSGLLGNDSITGGLGNDVLNGAAGNDTYSYALGDGNDTILDASGLDKIMFGAGIAPQNVLLERSVSDPGDLILHVSGGAGQITIVDHFAGAQMEEIVFQDGTVWTAAFILQALIAEAQTAGNDVVIGSDGVDTFSAGAGDDRVSGLSGNDSITGGAGNDLLNGDAGNDVYYYGQGDGQDTIIDALGTDQIVFGAGISPADIVVERSAADLNDLILRVAGGGQITIVDHFNGSPVEQVVFANGTVWTTTFLLLAATLNSPLEVHGTILNDVMTGTILNDRLFGEGGDDTIQGGVGNDYANGWSGNDRYIFNLGGGQDVFYGVTGTDTLELGSGIASSDILVRRDFTNANFVLLQIAGTQDSVSISDVETITFANGQSWSIADVYQRYLDQTITSGDDYIQAYGGNDVIDAGAGDDRIYAGDGNDVIRGGTGDDIAEGSAGNDRYIFNLGDGQDVFSGLTGQDTLEFGSGINPSDIIVRRDETNTNYLRLEIAGTLDRVSILDVETIVFANGVSWAVSALQVEPLLAATGTLKFFGDSNDNLLIGTSGADEFTGEGGNDMLIGSTGSDVFRFSRGDGRDTITDDGAASFTDVLTFGAGIAPGDILIQSIAGRPNDLLLTLKGTDDAIYIDDQLAGNGSGLEQVRFADGTVWTRTSLVATDLLSQATSGADTIYGSIFADTLQGSLGADTLKGSFGSDTYLFNAGDGQDTIVDLGGLPTDNAVSFGSGLLAANLTLSRPSPGSADLVVQFAGSSDRVTVEGQFSGGGVGRLEFHDGTVLDRAAIQNLLLQQSSTSGADEIFGFATNDTLTGGLGNDVLHGNGGNDTFVFHLGDGLDTISDFHPGSSAGDVIHLDGYDYESFSDLLADAYQSGADTVIAFDAGNHITLTDVVLTQLHESDFIFT